MGDFNMKLAIVIIALIGATLASLQDAPQPAAERQDKPQPASERQDEPQSASERGNDMTCSDGPSDPKNWCNAKNKYFCTANTSHKQYFKTNCRKTCGLCDDGCKSDEFRCKTGRTKYGSRYTAGGRTYSGYTAPCMPISWVCDHEFDCQDGSDEDYTDSRVS